MHRRSYRYAVVDVFTHEPFAGNPLAVVFDAGDLDAATMQRVAREFNLSETAFVSPPERDDVDANVRIFTPAFEVPFAGHPTIGTTFALAEDGAIDESAEHIVLEERIGPVAVRIEAREPFVAWLRTPPIRFGERIDAHAAAALLGLEPEDLRADVPVHRLSAGNPFLYVAVRDASVVDRAVLDRARMLATLSRESAIGIFVFAATESGAYSRMLEPTLIGEDPATGSATGPLGAFLLEYGLIERRDGARFTSEQGTAFGRRSFVHGIVRLDARGDLDTVEVGGGAVAIATGTIRI